MNEGMWNAYKPGGDKLAGGVRYGASAFAAIAAEGNVNFDTVTAAKAENQKRV